jgi:hypothetical protein
MQYAISPSTVPSVRTISRTAEFTSAGIAEAATRLRSWALIQGEQLTGLPFLRISGDLHCEVHIPVVGKVHPHPETGVSVEIGEGGPAVALRVVRFEEIRAVIRELTGEIAVDCGLAGPVEFHPSSAEFRHGTLVWPVHKPMRAGRTADQPQLVEAGG